MKFVVAPMPPEIEYSPDQMDELAKNGDERRVDIPGVQAKLARSLIKKKTNDKYDTRLTVFGALEGRYIFKPPADKCFLYCP